MEKGGFAAAIRLLRPFWLILLRAKVLAASAPTNTNKSGAVMISRRLTRAYFLFRLVVVHPLVDSLKNLSLRQAGIF